MPERLGSLADTAPVVAPRMMSGQWQDLLDPAIRKRLEQQIGVPIDPDAIRERLEQEIGFADFGKYSREQFLEGVRLFQLGVPGQLRLRDSNGAIWSPADLVERLRRRFPEPGPQSQAPRESHGSLAAYAPAPPQLTPLPPALSARVQALLNRQPGQELDGA